MRKILYLTAAICIFIWSMNLGCAIKREKERENTILKRGTVRFIDLEGGFYGIIGDDGKKYDPINLSQEFQVDGLPVRFEAEVRDDVAAMRMWGTPIEIVRIEKLE
ncbi:MAG TPA: hypothetical protein VHT73_11335 [Thermodesulfobacteriota bacterium]|nr:hypothetical protein [Thermodesulfobacteriota bacterium]